MTGLPNGIKDRSKCRIPLFINGSIRTRLLREYKNQVMEGEIDRLRRENYPMMMKNRD
jgi:hypothetical protein